MQRLCELCKGVNVMRIVGGFILTRYKDPKTKKEKMIPFFPLVRSTDIIPTETAEIGDCLQKMSERWVLTSRQDSLTETKFNYSLKYSDFNGDKTEEAFGSSYSDSTVSYILKANGDLEVSGIVRVDGETVEREDKFMVLRSIYLPYALPSETVDVCTTYPYGNVANLSICCSSELVKITNKNLVLPGRKKNNMFCGKIIIQTTMDPNPDSELGNIYKICDRKGSVHNYRSYISKYIPVKFVIDGLRWKN